MEAWVRPKGGVRFFSQTQLPKRRKVANGVGEETRALSQVIHISQPCVMKTQEVSDSVTHPRKKAARSPRSDIRRRTRWAARLFGPRSRTAGSGATGDRAALSCLCITTYRIKYGGWFLAETKTVFQIKRCTRFCASLRFFKTGALLIPQKWFSTYDH